MYNICIPLKLLFRYEYIYMYDCNLKPTNMHMCVCDCSVHLGVVERRELSRTQFATIKDN